MRHAAAYWRDRPRPASRSPPGWSTPVLRRRAHGQRRAGNYGAAKAGIAALTLVAAAELARYGVIVNAIAPCARTPMTEAVFADAMARPETGFDAMAPENVSPLVVWLAGADAGDVTGRGLRGRRR